MNLYLEGGNDTLFHIIHHQFALMMNTLIYFGAVHYTTFTVMLYKKPFNMWINSPYQSVFDESIVIPIDLKCVF